MKKNLSLEERMWNAWGSVECERLHGIHQFCAMACHQPEDYGIIWDRSDNCAWGFVWGWLRGWKEMCHAQYVDLEIKHLIYDVEMPKIYPEASGVEAGIIGFTEFNELNSGVVEVADDGKSCRTSYTSHGMCYIHFNKDKKRWAAFTNERYGADFIYDEKDCRWKYLHELVAPDGGVQSSFDVTNAYESYQEISEKVPYPSEDGWNVPLSEVRIDRNTPPEDGNIKEKEYTAFLPPLRSYKETLHYGWSPIQPVQKTILPPEPYATSNADNSYLPEDVKLDPDIFYKDEKDNWCYDIDNRFPTKK